MAVNVYIVKRKLKEKRRNGQQKYKLALRWKDPLHDKWRCESTASADMTEARALQKLKWAEVNGLIAPRIEAEPESGNVRPSWLECREALGRAMRADNLRPSYVSDALLLFDALRAAFPEAEAPADVTHDMANEYKRRRAEGDVEHGIRGKSPWTIRGDLATLRAIFGKWLGGECGLQLANPFANIKAPRCDDPEVRIVSAEESADLFGWFNERWNNWRLPGVYLEVAALLGWRATELASMRHDDVLADGHVRVLAESSKTRRHKFGWLPRELHDDLRACAADGWAFGRFADELRRLLMLWRHQPHHAARIKGFTPERMVGWIQDELKRYNDLRAKEAQAIGRPWEPFTLHDFRRTAITGMQMAGVSEKEASVMVGATPEVMRKHYEKLDQMAIAKSNVERRLGLPLSLRAGCARPKFEPLDDAASGTKTVSA